MHARSLTTLMTLASFLVMTISGLILYFEPQGRIAYWVNWKFLGLTKEDWDHLHVVSSLLWVVAVSFHLYFNWRILTSYIYKKIKGGLQRKKELAVTAVATVIMVVFSIFQIPPISYLNDFSTWLKDSWVTSSEYEPPFGHAESLSIKSFCKKQGIDLKAALVELENNGLKVEGPEQTLQDIAAANQTSAMEIYRIIKPFGQKAEPAAGKEYTPEMVDVEFSGTGLGRKTFTRLAEELGLPGRELKRRLTEKGVEVELDETFKTAADRYNLKPVDLLKAVLVKDYRLE